MPISYSVPIPYRFNIGKRFYAECPVCYKHIEETHFKSAEYLEHCKKEHLEIVKTVIY
jgi:hypothetical protein